MTKQSRNRQRGKKARASGSRFELKVRKDWESKGWIVNKWTNNVEFFLVNDFSEAEYYEEKKLIKEGKLIPAKPKWTPKGIIMNSQGFPDFICFKEFYIVHKDSIKLPNDKVETNMSVFINIGVEVKSNGYLDKTEKEKCEWLLANKIFSKILIASKSKKRGEIIYKEFKK